MLPVWLKGRGISADDRRRGNRVTHLHIIYWVLRGLVSRGRIGDIGKRRARPGLRDYRLLREEG